MSQIFYDALIDWNKLHQVVDSLELEHEERQECLEHAEEVLHTELLMLILEHLPLEHHEVFIERFTLAPHDPVHMIYLHRHARPEIERILRDHSTAVIDDLILTLIEE